MGAYLTSFLPIILMFGIMYFILILPEKKRTKKYNEMLGSLKVNDEVVTRGGIVGKIISMEDDNLVIQSGPERTRIKIIKTSVSQKVNKDVE